VIITVIGRHLVSVISANGAGLPRSGGRREFSLRPRSPIPAIHHLWHAGRLCRPVLRPGRRRLCRCWQGLAPPLVRDENRVRLLRVVPAGPAALSASAPKSGCRTARRHCHRQV